MIQLQVMFTGIGFLLALGAIVLLITSEIVSPYDGLTNLTINKKKLKAAAIGTGMLFLVALFVRIYLLIYFP